LNRIADVLFDPLFLGLALLALSLVHGKRRPWLARALPLVALALLLFFGTPYVANELARRTELPTLTTAKPGVVYDAVIVLGGAMDAAITREHGLFAYRESAERVLTAYDVLRTNQAKNAILSGGHPGLQTEESEASLMMRQLVAWGIDPSRLALDEDSTDTHENAIDSVRIARQRGWTRDLLVTSAAHMERAEGCFAREGLAVDTLAVDFTARRPSSNPAAFLPRAGALAESAALVRERVGRLVYRLRGWTR
jgi:uncharacterized SAM-binding protein YcdF (DUF218 family)